MASRSNVKKQPLINSSANSMQQSILQSSREGLDAFWNPCKKGFSFQRPIVGRQRVTPTGPILKIWPTPPSIPKQHQISLPLSIPASVNEKAIQLKNEHYTKLPEQSRNEGFVFHKRSPGDGCVSPLVSSDRSLVKQSSSCIALTEDRQRSGCSSAISFEDQDLDGFEPTEEYDEETCSSRGLTSCTTSRASSAVSRSCSQIDIARIKENVLETRHSRTQKASSGNDAQYPLMNSLFDHIPPTLYFASENDEVVLPLPYDVRRLLKWKVSAITPKVIKSCVTNIGFRLTKKSNDWIASWGKHMKALSFKSIKRYQKVNHFPGTFQIGRKDLLWKNYIKMQLLHGKKEFDYCPTTYVLPGDFKMLKKAWDSCGPGMKWIVKPPASARGIGIRVVHKWSQIPRKKPSIVQKYISNPYLINGNKFDLRVYVYVTSYDPLRIYVYDEGLVRFATEKYSTAAKSLSNRFAHLTNYSINKKNKSAYKSDTLNSEDSNAHKWNLKSLWAYLRKSEVNTTSIWEKIKDIIIKTIISAEATINSLTKQNLQNSLSCHELFGFDIILDANLKPWLLEVNISPSLHSNSKLDADIKGKLVIDMLNLAGLRIPKSLLSPLGRSANLEAACADEQWFQIPTLNENQRLKHAQFAKKHVNQHGRSAILSNLTSDDIRILMETDDENSRRGSFQRLFPSSNKLHYSYLFETQRYYNILLDEWIKRYWRDSKRPDIGISILQSYSQSYIEQLSQGTVGPKKRTIAASIRKVSPARSAKYIPVSIRKIAPMT